MNRKTFIVAALALAGSLVAGLAQARSDVQWSVTIGGPIGVPVYSQPYPVYSQPYPVYNQPYPVYSQPAPIYTQPAPVYLRPVPVYSQPYPQHWRGQVQYQEPTRWDRDGDGIPNRHDRLYNPRWDRDGDGVPNRYERYERYERDDRDDRHDGRRR